MTALDGPARPLTSPLHATAVSVDGKGVLILGPSGSGKSSLALDLITQGAGLIADDQVTVEPMPSGPPRLSAPPGLPPMIELRRVGLVPVRLAPPCPVALVIDLGQSEDHRLPPDRRFDLAGASIRLILGPIRHNLGAAIALLCRSMEWEPT